jgi:hypothetical protein
MFTTSDQPVDIEQAYSEGANSFLLKPTDFLELLPRIRCFAEYWLTHNVPPICVQEQPHQRTRMKTRGDGEAFAAKPLAR